MRCVIVSGAVLVLAGCQVGPTAEAPCFVNRSGWRTDDQNPVGIISMLNVGRYCGITVRNDGRGNEATGVVVARPEHGQARMRATQGGIVGEYRPAPGFTGSDEFKASFGPGSQTVTILISVQPPP